MEGVAYTRRFGVHAGNTRVSDAKLGLGPDERNRFGRLPALSSTPILFRPVGTSPTVTKTPLRFHRTNEKHSKSLSKNVGRKILGPCFRELSFDPHFSTASTVLDAERPS